jgi:hypothetical protein
VGPRAGLDAMAKRSFLHYPCSLSNPSRPACSLVTVLSDLQNIKTKVRLKLSLSFF